MFDGNNSEKNPCFLQTPFSFLTLFSLSHIKEIEKGGYAIKNKPR